MQYKVTDNAGIEHSIEVINGQVTAAPGMLCPILPISWNDARHIWAVEGYIIEKIEEIQEDTVSENSYVSDFLAKLGEY